MNQLIVLPKLLENTYREKEIEQAKKVFEKYYTMDVMEPQRDLMDVVNTIFSSEYGQFFMRSMNNLQVDKLYASDIHGQDHVERVCVLAAYLAIQNKLDEHMLMICIESAKYHDIGRIDDSNDSLHGYRGAEKIQECCKGISEWDYGMIAAIVEAHSLLDEEAEGIFRKYQILKKNDYEVYMKILHIVKDADALDRFRLTPYSLKVEYLRMIESRQLVLAACEMYLLSQK